MTAQPAGYSARSAERKRGRRLRHLGFWVYMVLANLILIPIGVSLFVGFGVVWSSTAGAAAWHTVIGCKGGEFGYRRYVFPGTSTPASPPAPTTTPIVTTTEFQFWSKSTGTWGWGNAAWWIPPSPPLGPAPVIPGIPAPIGISTVTIPFYFPLLPLVGGLVLLARKEYRAMRARRGCCRACGYTLRAIPANPDGTKTCPECGHTRVREREGSGH